MEELIKDLVNNYCDNCNYLDSCIDTYKACEPGSYCHKTITTVIEKLRDSDKVIKLLIENLILPYEMDLICDDLHGYEEDEDGESWCAKNCSFDCPQEMCVHKWLQKKMGDEE